MNFIAGVLSKFFGSKSSVANATRLDVKNYDRPTVVIDTDDNILKLWVWVQHGKKVDGESSEALNGCILDALSSRVIERDLVDEKNCYRASLWTYAFTYPPNAKTQEARQKASDEWDKESFRQQEVIFKNIVAAALSWADRNNMDFDNNSKLQELNQSPPKQTPPGHDI